MDVERIRRRLLISGRVQGVWFRGAMERQAALLGATGWVRNLPDGRVEAVVEGSADVVNRMTEWCHHGPPGAAVTGVMASSEPAEGFDNFDIRY